MNRILSILSLGLVLFVTACNKGNEEPEVLTKEEAKEALETMRKELLGDYEDLFNSEGLLTVEEVLYQVGMENPDFMMSARKLSTGKVKGSDLRKAAADVKQLALLAQLRQNSNGLFDFNANKGVYDVVDGELVKKESSNKIIINVDGADAVITLHSYSEAPYNDPYNSELEYLPTSFKADIFASGKKQVEVEFSGSYTEGSEQVSLNIYLNPFTLNLGSKVESSKNVGFTFNLNNKDVSIIDLALGFNYTPNLKEGELSSITGHIAHRTTKLQGSINAEINPNSSLNDLVDLTVYSDNKILGEIVFIGDEPYIKYSDDSTESIEDILISMFGNMSL